MASGAKLDTAGTIAGTGTCTAISVSDLLQWDRDSWGRWVTGKIINKNFFFKLPSNVMSNL